MNDKIRASIASTKMNQYWFHNMISKIDIVINREKCEKSYDNNNNQWKFNDNFDLSLYFDIDLLSINREK